MTQEIVERIIDETVDTIIDSIDEKTVDYMFEYGNYEETDNQFLEDLKILIPAVRLLKSLFKSTAVPISTSSKY